MPFENQDTTIILPEGAGVGEARLVMGTDIPEPLKSYEFSDRFDSTGTAFAALIAYSENSEDYYAYTAWVRTSFNNLLVCTGRVENGAVEESTIRGRTVIAGSTHDATLDSAYIETFGGPVRAGSLSLGVPSTGGAYPLSLGYSPVLGDITDHTDYFRVREDGYIRWGASGSLGSTTVIDRDTATYENHSSSGYAAVSVNAPTITFHVPPSRHGNIRMMVRADADAIGERFRADVIIRETNSSGTIVHSPNENTGGIEEYFEPDLPSFKNFYGDRPLEELNLAPGQYWAQLHVDTLGTTIDIAEQWIRFEPSL